MAGLMLGWATTEPAATSGIQSMQPRDLRAALDSAPPPIEGERIQALLQPESGIGEGSQGLLQNPTRLALEDFEDGSWPAGTSLHPAASWLVESLTDLRGGSFGYHWAGSDCRAAGGLRSLCAICGGTGGQQLGCDDPYPDGVASSVILRLDLAPWREMDRLDLVMDIWTEAEPHEGLIVNYLDYARDGSLRGRHAIRSFTGQLMDWARDQRIDLLRAVDEEDPSWTRNFAGQIILLELLFVSSEDAGNGRGIYIDDMALEFESSTVVVTAEASPTATASATPRSTPTPSVGPSPSATPGDRTVYCPSGQDCSRLRVEAFIDLRCDGRYNAGVDSWVTGRRIDLVTGGGVALGGPLSRRGSIYFLLPSRDGAEVRFDVPSGYEMCANSPNPREVSAGDFGRFGNEQIDFRIRRQR